MLYATMKFIIGNLFIANSDGLDMNSIAFHFNKINKSGLEANIVRKLL